MDIAEERVHPAAPGPAGAAISWDESLKYRADIDGLRTMAVLPVVLYHLDIPPFSGGFVGVDVFFVISGFLITSVIWAQLQTGVGIGGLLVGFYDRRIRRIFPALAVVLAFTVAVGGWLLLPLDLRDLGRSLMATTLFISNIYFWLVAGYFDAPAHTKPLLHTWSLAMEEQFYIVFPILAYALHRLSRARVLVVLAVLAVVNLGEAAVVAALALLASDLSLRWVEAPFRGRGVARGPSCSASPARWAQPSSRSASLVT